MEEGGCKAVFTAGYVQDVRRLYISQQHSTRKIINTAILSILHSYIVRALIVHMLHVLYK